MIRTVTITNIEAGEDLVLTLANPEISKGVAIVNMSGLGPEKATLNSTEWATIDGGCINSTHIPMRQITMELKFIPTSYDETVADIRRLTYSYFPLKKYVRLTFDMYDLKHGHKRYYIDGCVEENTPTIWSDSEGCNITIKCEDPAFKDDEETYISFSNIRGVFHMAKDDNGNPTAFPDDYMGHPWPIAEILHFEELTVTNKSTLDVGAVFTIRAKGGTVVNPVIYNRTTNQRMSLNLTMTNGMKVIIDTRTANKKVYNGDGSDENMLQYLDIGSSFIYLIPGDNLIGYVADSGSKYLDLEFKYREKYQGV